MHVYTSMFRLWSSQIKSRQVKTFFSSLCKRRNFSRLTRWYCRNLLGEGERARVAPHTTPAAMQVFKQTAGWTGGALADSSCLVAHKAFICSICSPITSRPNTAFMWNLVTNLWFGIIYCHISAFKCENFVMNFYFESYILLSLHLCKILSESFIQNHIFLYFCISVNIKKIFFYEES